jgi:bifunctional DNA-binding transcriptional regulator/antitoxin component of YhaV-PrlF toxin-antitoxin module
MLRETRFIDSGWRLTIPKAMRTRLGWDKDTEVCVSWDGQRVHIRHPLRCRVCSDLTRLGALGKIVIPPRVRTDAQLYRGQILSLDIEGDEVIVMAEGLQVRCQACGSEMDVKESLPNVHLCRRCREALDRIALDAASPR